MQQLTAVRRFFEPLHRGGNTIENVRLKGFVIGFDKVGNDTVWKVRVNDEINKLHRRKFEVASVHGDIQLAQGLEVEFLLGNFRKDGHSVQKAVDVTILWVHATDERGN